MTDQEFDLLDELYFVVSLSALQETLGWTRADVLENLACLLAKGWARCIDRQDQTLDISPADLPAYADTCLFLATKEGLKAHNTR